MEQNERMKQGAFSWNEFLTNDVSAAKAFYSELFGWQLRDEQMGDATYTIINIGDKQIGGIMAYPPDMQDTPPAWGAYVTVDDVDKQVIKAEKLGGKIVTPPRDIPNVGRYAVINDPQGAMLNLITYTRQA